MKTSKERLRVRECGVEGRNERGYPEIGACPAPRQEFGWGGDRYSMRLQKGKGVGDERATIGRELEARYT